MYQRFTMANMAVEAGAKSGIIEPDEITLAWLRGRARQESRGILRATSTRGTKGY